MAADLTPATPAETVLGLWIQHLTHERRASARTVESYAANLRAYFAFLTGHTGAPATLQGLGEVSAALPRALVPHYDIRVLIPGYRQVRAAFPEIPVVARLEGFAGIPACDLGLVEAADGLRIYVLLSPDLYERDGTPYGDQHGDSVRKPQVLRQRLRDRPEDGAHNDCTEQEDQHSAQLPRDQGQPSQRNDDQRAPCESAVILSLLVVRHIRPAHAPRKRFRFAILRRFRVRPARGGALRWSHPSSCPRQRPASCS